mgnify:FL=1
MELLGKILLGVLVFWFAGQLVGQAFFFVSNMFWDMVWHFICYSTPMSVVFTFTGIAIGVPLALWLYVMYKLR